MCCSIRLLVHHRCRSCCWYRTQSNVWSHQLFLNCGLQLADLILVLDLSAANQSTIRPYVLLEGFPPSSKENREMALPSHAVQWFMSARTYMPCISPKIHCQLWMYFHQIFLWLASMHHPVPAISTSTSVILLRLANGGYTLPIWTEGTIGVVVSNVLRSPSN